MKVITAHMMVNMRTATLKVTGVTTATTARYVTDRPVSVTVKGNQSKQEAEYMKVAQLFTVEIHWCV